MPQGKQRSNKPKKRDEDRKKNSAKKDSRKQTSKQSQAKTDLYDPRATLTGKTLKKFVKSQVRQQTKPEINANKRVVKSLKQILKSQTGQLKDFDKQASHNIDQYYDDAAQSNKSAVATSAALGARLTGDLASQGSQTAGTIQSASDSATAALNADQALRQDSSSSARAELQQIIAMQQGNAATESQALQGKGAAQANTWTNFIQGMGQANQMRGSAALADLHQGTKSSITDLQNQYAPDIREALGNIKDARSSKGDLRNQLLAQLRGDERQYLLSKGALGIDKESLKSDLATARVERKAAKKSKTGNPTLDVAKQYGKNKKAEQLRTLENQLKVIEAQSGAKAKEQAQSLRNQIKVIKAQQQGKGGKLADYDKGDRQRAVNIARGAGSMSFINGNKQQVIAEMGRRYGVNPVLARWAVNKILKKHKLGSQSNTDFYESHPLG